MRIVIYVSRSYPLHIRHIWVIFSLIKALLIYHIVVVIMQFSFQFCKLKSTT